MARMSKKDRLVAAVEELRLFALAYPESTEDFPWGHRAIKVRGKIFVTLVFDDDALRTSMKLRASNLDALLLPFTEPTHYGMGKHGWVTAQFAPGEVPPVELIKAWMDESYRLIAPKTLVKRLPD
jgi:predicted DNA-binding protein (MmcQ/YjbR family)